MTISPISSTATKQADDPELLAELFGAFPGYTASPGRLEQLLAMSIRRKHFEGASELCDTAWWDYRPMSLGHSFMLFVVERIRTMKRLAGKGLVNRKGAKAGITVQSILDQSGALIWDYDNRDIAALWKAKAAADTFGIPYGKFVELTISTALDAGWLRIPSPNQWYNENRLVAVIDAWEKILRIGVPLAKHPIYLAENYQSHPWQDAYQDWLMDNIGSRASVARGIANVMLFTPQLLEAKAITRFGEEEVERARSLYKREKR